MSDRLAWQDDKLLIDDVAFYLQTRRDDARAMQPGYFTLFKSRPLIAAYLQFFSLLGLRPRTLFEIGIWDGGSTAFWHEVFRPEKHIAIDRSVRGDSEYFDAYLDSRGGRNVIKTYWGTPRHDTLGLPHFW